MLDAATCAIMRTAIAPQASASALAALSALLSEVMARSPLAAEASERGRIGFRDHPQGDRHAAPVTPSIHAPARAVYAPRQGNDRLLLGLISDNRPDRRRQPSWPAASAGGRA
jgi:hypothetical protein